VLGVMAWLVLLVGVLILAGVVFGKADKT